MISFKVNLVWKEHKHHLFMKISSRYTGKSYFFYTIQIMYFSFDDYKIVSNFVKLKVNFLLVSQFFSCTLRRIEVV